jgi:hypothetical protein
MKTSRVVALVAAPVGAYLLASWIVGAKVQSALEDQYKMLEGPALYQGGGPQV